MGLFRFISTCSNPRLGLCAEDEEFCVRVFERLGIPVISRATKDALADVSHRSRQDCYVTDEEIEAVLYAVGVILEAAGNL